MTEIGDLALLSDCSTAALVGSDGSVDWWPGPRFDGATTLARVLDPKAGHFAVRPAHAGTVSRDYLPGTMVLRTEHETPAGVLRVTDCLALGPGERGHDIGLRSPDALVRLAEAVGGEVDVEVELAPRPEYGLVVPRLAHERGAIATVGGPHRLFLTGGDDLEIDGATARGRFRLRDGERRALVLRRVVGMDATRPDPIDAAAEIAETAASWRSWSDLHQGYDGPYRDEVLRSGLVVLALTYQRSSPARWAPPTARTRRFATSSGWPVRRRPAATTSTCRSSSGSKASARCTSRSSTTCAATATAARCGSATAPGARRSSMFSARCSTSPGGCATTSSSTTSTPRSSATSSNGPPSTGALPTPGSGRPAARRATTRPRR